MIKKNILIFSLKQVCLGVEFLVKLSAGLVPLFIAGHVSYSIAVSNSTDISSIIVRSCNYIMKQYLNLFSITAFNISLLAFLSIIFCVNFFSLLFDKKAVETMEHLNNE